MCLKTTIFLKPSDLIYLSRSRQVKLLNILYTFEVSPHRAVYKEGTNFKLHHTYNKKKTFSFCKLFKAFICKTIENHGVGSVPIPTYMHAIDYVYMCVGTLTLFHPLYTLFLHNFTLSKPTKQTQYR